MSATAMRLDAQGIASNFPRLRSRTNPLGPNTRNLSVNVPTEEDRILGRLAFQRGESKSKLAKALMVLGLQTINPALAEEVREARRQLKSAMLLGVLIIGAISSWFSGEDLEMRRAKRVNAARIIRRAQEETV